MIAKFKTPCPFWERPCSNFGNGYVVPCSNFGNTLSPFWERIRPFWVSACSNFGDILNNHTPLTNISHSITETRNRTASPKAEAVRALGRGEAQAMGDHQ